MTLPRFMRTKSGLPVEVLAQNVSNLVDYAECSVIVLVRHYDGYNRIGYRKADGSHPRPLQEDLGLIPYKTMEAAKHAQCVLEPSLYTAAQLLWKAGDKDLAVKIIATGQTEVHELDFARYLNELWG